MKRRRAVGLLLLALGGLAVGVGIAEVGLRLAGISEPVFYRVDEHRGWSLIPGAEGWWRGEGETYVRINGDGLRDRERSRSKPDDVYRIAVLGDSFTAAFHVPLEKTFCSVMERRLEACPALAGKRVEVLNFGVANYGTTHELLTLRHHASRYAPDLVVLAMFTGNDIHNNSAALNPDDVGPRFVKRGEELALDLSFRDTGRYRLLASAAGRLYYGLVGRSRVAQLANRARGALRRVARPRAAGGVEGGVSFAIYREPTDPRWREAWEITERLVVMVRDEAEAGGARLLVVTLSNPEQVHPDAEVRRERSASLGVDDLFYPDRRIEALGEREGIDVLTLARPMRDHADRTGAFLHGFTDRGEGHWNEEGHRVAGRLIADRICAGPLASSG